MKTAKFAIAILAFFASVVAVSGQQARKAAAAKSPPTIASIMNAQLGLVEQQFVAAAEAMPEDKYSFAPSGDNFKGVRTFAQEVKHVATANYYFYDAILGQVTPANIAANKQNNGPDDLQTKEQIIKYLKDSFALGHKAISTITARNATALVSKPPVPFLNTRLALASFGCTHAFDHYGQMVEYLRMNGIVPPASKGQPPANPSSNEERGWVSFATPASDIRAAALRRSLVKHFAPNVGPELLHFVGYAVPHNQHPPRA